MSTTKSANRAAIVVMDANGSGEVVVLNFDGGRYQATITGPITAEGKASIMAIAFELVIELGKAIVVKTN